MELENIDKSQDTSPENLNLEHREKLEKAKYRRHRNISLVRSPFIKTFDEDSTSSNSPQSDPMSLSFVRFHSDPKRRTYVDQTSSKGLSLVCVVSLL